MYDNYYIKNKDRYWDTYNDQLKVILNYLDNYNVTPVKSLIKEWADDYLGNLELSKKGRSATVASPKYDLFIVTTNVALTKNFTDPTLRKPVYERFKDYFYFVYRFMYHKMSKREAHLDHETLFATNFECTLTHEDINASLSWEHQPIPELFRGNN